MDDLSAPLLAPPIVIAEQQQGWRQKVWALFKTHWTKLLVLAVCLSIWFSPPFSAELTPASMQLLGVFLAVMLALLITDIPISILAGIGMTVLALTGSLMCTSSTGTYLPCSSCEPDAPVGSSEHCDPSADAFKASLSGFSNDVNWLVFCAFHIGFAVERTQLGRRLSLLIVRRLGHSLLGLGYAVFCCELLLGPFVPSNTARGGGVMMPLVTAIARTLGSTADSRPKSGGGEFLILCGAHANLLSASMFATGMAANPLIPRFARQVFGGVEFSYLNWLAGSVVPGLLATALLPPLLLWLSLLKRHRGDGAEPLDSNAVHDDGRPLANDNANNPSAVAENQLQLQHSRDNSYHQMINCDLTRQRRKLSNTSSRSADNLITNNDGDIAIPLAEGTAGADTFAALRSQVRQDLLKMGRMSRDELLLVSTLLACFALWLTKSWTGLDTHLVAFMTVMVLVVLQLISWDDVVRNYKAVDTFFWLGAFIMMATQLGLFGVTQSMGRLLGETIGQWQPSPLFATILLALTYFLSMYLFSSLTGHIIAFAEPFMAAAKHLQCPPLLITALLAYFSTLCGCLTNFSSGPVVIYFAQGYCKQRTRWFAIGLAVGVLYWAIYLSVGLLWWRLIGFW